MLRQSRNVYQTKHVISTLIPTPKTSPSSDSNLTGLPEGSSNFQRSLTPIATCCALFREMLSVCITSLHCVVIDYRSRSRLNSVHVVVFVQLRID